VKRNLMNAVKKSVKPRRGRDDKDAKAPKTPQRKRKRRKRDEDEDEITEEEEYDDDTASVPQTPGDQPDDVIAAATDIMDLMQATPPRKRQESEESNDNLQSSYSNRSHVTHVSHAQSVSEYIPTPVGAVSDYINETVSDYINNTGISVTKSPSGHSLVGSHVGDGEYIKQEEITPMLLTRTSSPSFLRSESPVFMRTESRGYAVRADHRSPSPLNRPLLPFDEQTVKTLAFSLSDDPFDVVIDSVEEFVASQSRLSGRVFANITSALAYSTSSSPGIESYGGVETLLQVVFTQFAKKEMTECVVLLKADMGADWFTPILMNVF
jgi:hypothetical protein